MSIVALEQKAEVLRRLARDFGFTFSESAVPDQPGAIRFTFELSEEELNRFLPVVPRDVFARVGYLL